MKKVHQLGILGCVVTLAGVVGMGCGQKKGGPTDTIAIDVPSRPTPTPGQALLGGRVLDASGQVMAGATVKVAETDKGTTTDAGGVYSLAVPADSTVTLAVASPGMASSLRESVVLAAGASIHDFDLRLLPIDQMTAINRLAGPAAVTGRGLMALRLHSAGAGCTLAGARVSVFPPGAATVVYSAAASSAGALDLPDATLQAVQPDTEVAAWLTAALPPGNANLLSIKVQQDGCLLMAQSPSLDGLMFPGQRAVAAQTLTEADLFLADR